MGKSKQSENNAYNRESTRKDIEVNIASIYGLPFYTSILAIKDTIYDVTSCQAKLVAWT